MTKVRCEGRITSDRRNNQGDRCKLWARPNSPYCARHQGGNGAGTPRSENELARRCIARSSQTGSQCKSTAMRGQRVCRKHGGGAPQSRRKAQDLLDRMVEPVLWELRDIALNPKTSESDRLRAINMVLDRTLPKERKLEVEIKPWEIAMQHSLKGRELDPTIATPPPEYVLEQLEGMDLDPATWESEAEEAEVVEDPRDALPQIRPAQGESERATYVRPTSRVGSAEPPKRRTFE